MTFFPYTYDSTTGRLYLRGHEVRLPAQNAKMLNALLRQPGLLVTREELREELWPGMVAVDFEQSINKIVSQLRSALQDDPKLPRFIETFPRKGYRFAAAVKYETLPGVDAEEPGTAISLSAEERDRSLLRPEGGGTEPPGAPEETQDRSVVEPSPATVRPARPMWRLLGWGLAGVAVLLAVALGLRHRVLLAADANRSITIGIPPMRTTDAASTLLAESFRSRLSDRISLLPGIKVRSIHIFSASTRDSGFMQSLALQPAAGILLLGTLQVHGEVCDVDLEMVHEADLSHLASLHYQVTPQELGVLDKRAESDVVSRIKRSEQFIAPRLSLELESYIEGRHLLEARTTASLQESVKAFERALAINPRFSLGYSGLASVNLLLADRSLSPDGYAKAREKARTALEIDSSNAEAHAVLGALALSMDSDAGTAEASLRRAIELDPGEATYHLWLASLLNCERRFDEALQQIQSAREGDPFWPPIYQTQAMVAGNAGHFADAIGAAENLTRLTPIWPYAYDELAWVQWYAGKPAEAASTWTRMTALGGTPAQKLLAKTGESVLRQNGIRAYAVWRLQHQSKLFDSGYHSASLQQAEWQAYGGNDRAAAESIAAMIRSRDPSLIQIAPDPALQTFPSVSLLASLYKPK